MKRSLRQPQSAKSYNFPVEGCMFFGVPNLGTEYATGAASILKVLNIAFNVNRNVVQELASKSQRLANIASEFRQIRNEHKIPVISFYETEKYNYALGLVSIRLSFAASPRYFAPCTAPKSPKSFPKACTMNAANGPCEPRFFTALSWRTGNRSILYPLMIYVFIANSSDCQ